MRRFTTLLALGALVIGSGRGIPDEQRETGLNDQGFITTWLLLAAIPLGENQIGADAIRKEQIKDEAKLEPKAGDKVKVGDAELVWKKYAAKDYYFDFNDFLGVMTEDCVGYAVCYIQSDADMKDIKLRIGCDDQARIYLNGKEVFVQEQPSSLVKDKYSTNVSLRKGANVLVFKVINEKVEWSGCARFTTKTAQIIKNLKVTAVPPK
jgi:hypothetical protein